MLKIHTLTCWPIGEFTFSSQTVLLHLSALTTLNKQEKFLCAPVKEQIGCKATNEHSFGILWNQYWGAIEKAETFDTVWLENRITKWTVAALKSEAFTKIAHLHLLVMQAW